MQLKDIKELIKTIKESDFTTFEIEEEGFKLVLKREKEVIQTQVAVSQPIQMAPMAVQATKSQNDGMTFQNVTPQKTEEVVVAASQAGVVIKSPIVGTFYNAPTPESAPFAPVGAKVKKGDILCIIEAMKLMNEIEADKDGEVAEVYVANEAMVEFGQPLFRII